MNSVDMMLLQMMAQIGPQAPETGKSASKQDGQFQDLLAKKSQEKAPQAGTQKPEAKPESKPVEGEAPVKEEPVADEQRVLAAALAAQALNVVPAQDAAALAAVQTTAPVVQTVAEVQEPQDAAVPEGQVQAELPQEAAPEARNTAPGRETAQAAKPETPVAQEKPVQAQEEAPQAERQTGVETKEIQPEAEKPVERQAVTEAEGGKTAETEVTDKQSAAAEAKPLFQKAEAPVKVGEPEAVDATKGDMDAQIAKQVEKALTQGNERIAIKLTPENLGTITVEMTRNAEGVLNVAIHTGSEKTLGLLSRHAENLGALLQSHTQAPVNVEVQHSQESQQYQQQQQQRQQEQQSGDSQGRQQQQQGRQRHEVQDFLQQLRLGLTPLGA